MITPCTDDHQLDPEAKDRLVDCYVPQGCLGVFAVYLSSKMFRLSEDDRLSLAARGRLCVAASDHVADAMDDYLRALQHMADTGRFFVIKDTCCDAELLAHREDILQAASLAFLPENIGPQPKACADYIVRSNPEGAVAHVIDIFAGIYRQRRGL